MDGQVVADNQQAAVGRLEAQGLSPVWVREGTSRRVAARWRRRGRTVSSRDVTVFTRQMAGLLKAGVPILKALTTISEQTESEAFRIVVSGILHDVRDGSTVSGAMAGHKDCFPEVYVNMVKAGESAGLLDEVLLRVADAREAEDELRGRVVAAMAYPALVLSVGAASIFVILTFFLPKIMHLFEGAMGALPFPTRVVLGLSTAMAHSWMWFLVAGVLAAAALRKYLLSDRGRLAFDRMVLRIPVVGRFMRDTDLVRFSRTLALLVRAGIPIERAIALSGNTLFNRRLRIAILHVGQETVRTGSSLAAGFAREPAIPPFLTNMIAVGEEGGRMDETLLEAAAFYQRELDRGLRLVTTLIEPALILLVGAVVGFIIFAMLLPIFQIGQTLR